MKNIRLKAALQPEQIADRLKYHPEILEIQLTEMDLFQPEVVVAYIRELKSRGIRVYLHHPTRFKGRYMDIISSSKEMLWFYDWSSKEIARICRQEEVKCIIHCHYSQSESSQFNGRAERKALRRRLEAILSICDRSFLWEDTIRGIYSAENPYLFSEIVEPLHLSINIDISHAFIALRGNNDRLHQHLDRFAPYARYFHIVDSMGVSHDGLPLGEGEIDWAMVKPYVGGTDFIFEVDLRDSNYIDCTKMIESAAYWNEI